MNDRYTKKGKEALELTRTALDIYQGLIGGYVAFSNDDTASAVDGFSFNPEHELTGLLEVKARNLSVDELWDGKDLWVGYNKIQSGIKLSRMLRVPYIFICYCKPDDIIVFWQITDGLGTLVSPLNKSTKMLPRSMNDKSLRSTTVVELSIENGIIDE